MVVGGNKADYPGKTSMKVAKLATTKLLLNSIISTPQAKFMGLDIKDFFSTPFYQIRSMSRSPFT
jgi:hypothetical protein